MEKIETPFEGLFELRPKVFSDSRGWFLESYKNSALLNEHIINHPFVQGNLSCSDRGVLRGLHFQAPPFAQAKLVMVVKGRALDVVVDLRKSSATYGEHYKVILDEREMNQLFIPRGFAHAFLALEENTLFHYQCDNEYQKESEKTLLWNDDLLDIDWQFDEPLVSEKDREGLSWKEFSTPFD